MTQAVAGRGPRPGPCHRHPARPKPKRDTRAGRRCASMEPTINNPRVPYFRTEALIHSTEGVQKAEAGYLHGQHRAVCRAPSPSHFSAMMPSRPPPCGESSRRGQSSARCDRARAHCGAEPARAAAAASAAVPAAATVTAVLCRLGFTTGPDLHFLTGCPSPDCAQVRHPTEAPNRVMIAPNRLMIAHGRGPGSKPGGLSRRTVCP